MHERGLLEEQVSNRPRNLHLRSEKTNVLAQRKPRGTTVHPKTYQKNMQFIDIASSSSIRIDARHVADRHSSYLRRAWRFLHRRDAGVALDFWAADDNDGGPGANVTCDDWRAAPVCG